MVNRGVVQGWKRFVLVTSGRRGRREGGVALAVGRGGVGGREVCWRR